MSEDGPPAGEGDGARARWRRIEALFAEVADLPASERAAYLARATDDVALATEVLDLVAVSTSAPSAMRDLVAREASLLTHEASGVRVGARLDGYIVKKRLGEGGMGAVVLAEPEAGGAAVAIKVLRHVDAEAIARLRDEEHILAALDHPGIVRLRASGRTDTGLPYLVMDYIDGASLTRHARALPIAERLALFLQVCAAVQYAHERGVVHRDLKPSNILVSADGRAHLLDFGIAKVLDPSAAAARHARTRTGMPLFTPEYASPEQVRGEVVTRASDVYSLGAVLFELLCGRPPLEATGDPLELLRRITEVTPPRPSALAPGVAPALDDIALTALAKAPAARYATVAELAADVERHLAGRPVTARATTPTRAGRGRGKTVLATIVLAALAVAMVLALTSSGGGDGGASTTTNANANTNTNTNVSAPAEIAPAEVATATPIEPAALPVAPDPTPTAVAPSVLDDLRQHAIVLRDGAGGTYVVRPGKDDARIFYGPAARAPTLFAQALRERFADARAGRWTLSVWDPHVGNLEPGAIARNEDGTFVRWCGSGHATPLVALDAAEAAAVLARARFVGEATVRGPYLLARDATGVYYYVDVLRPEHGGGAHRVFVGTAGAMVQLPLVAVALDSAGDVFATARGELRIVREIKREPSPGTTVRVTWYRDDVQIALTPIDLALNASLVYAGLGVTTFTGTICE